MTMRRKIKRCRDCQEELMPEDEDEGYCNECYLNHIGDEDMESGDDGYV
jgi:hypothetical protein